MNESKVDEKKKEFADLKNLLFPFESEENLKFLNLLRSDLYD